MIILSFHQQKSPFLIKLASFQRHDWAVIHVNRINVSVNRLPNTLQNNKFIQIWLK